MTTQVLFNQFAYADRLRRGGFTDEQARASAEALGVALSEAVATKTDIAEIKGEIAEAKADAKTEFAGVAKEFAAVRTEFAAVRTEIAAVRTEIAAVRTEIAEVRTEIATSKNDVIRWVLVLNFAMVSVLFAAIKLLK
jgi:septal ring factor EnvC (AmiA/AmiB activator)